MKLRRQGMTLIELLVVVAIVGILCGLVLPAILNARSASRKSQCAANLKQLAQAVNTFHHRNERLPVYWGSMKGASGERFGGWLMHLLPDLDQQALYDRITPTGDLNTTSVQVETYVEEATGEWNVPVPQSPDYQPGYWTSGTTVTLSGTFVFPILVAASGQPALPATPKTRRIVTGTVTRVGNWKIGGVGIDYANHTSRAALPFMLDSEDPSPMRGPVQSNPPNGFDGAPLTNYLLNAHVFTRWGLKAETNRSLDNPRNSAGRLLPTTPPPVSDPAGYFAPPAFNYPEYLPVINGVDNMWGHFCSGTLGPIGRTFNHVVDGFSNTILAAEFMRQCDAQRNFRYAFLPTGPSGTSTPFNEHSFGILPSLRSGTSGALFNTPFPSLTFGNTFMFQTQPKPEECNATRVQGLHGNYLMAAMCDGSVRAISSQVTRREPTGIMACGRLNHGTQFFDHRARGATAPDGIWDLLMMPADPPGSVLANTGEIGRER